MMTGISISLVTLKTKLTFYYPMQQELDFLIEREREREHFIRKEKLQHEADDEKSF